MLKSNFEFEVLVNGHPTKEYYHEGSYYIEGKEDSRFSLRMRNNTNNKVLFVPTVDGLSIMNGKEASFKSRGYVVNAYDSMTIDGWRTSDDKVAEFFFSSPKESYAGKTQKGNNLGVIGCAVFKEKERQPVKVIEKIIKEYVPYYPYYVPPTFPSNPWWCVGTQTTISSGSNSITYTAYNSSDSINLGQNMLSSTTTSNPKPIEAGLGTGFGQDKYSPVVNVGFDKEHHPAEVFSMYYNTKENLKAMGIEFKKAAYITSSAFPNEDDYCKRPE